MTKYLTDFTRLAGKLESREIKNTNQLLKECAKCGMSFKSFAILEQRLIKSN